SKSHKTCSAMVGQTPVRACTWPASLNFSSMVEAAAGCRNLPKRVPVLANPQEGISMRKRSSESKIFSEGADGIGDRLDDLCGEDDTQMIVGNEAEGARYFAGSMTQDDGAGGGNGERAI